MTFNGKTAVVTGGSRGIGRAIVRRFAAGGARVVFTHVGDDPGEILPGTTAVRADQADAGSVRAVLDEVRDGFDILVNNAAVCQQTPIAELTEDELDRVLAINFRTPLLLVRDALPLLRDGGRIVNISTLNTVSPSAGLVLYCTTKGAIEQLTAVAAQELGVRGITVNTVSPGATDTDMLRGANSPEGLAQAADLAALRRLGTPDDVAAVVAFLASADGGWVTGQNIRATGGLIF
jgi:3-oxoacyl-[acyl-carrier protein] reductase